MCLQAHHAGGENTDGRKGSRGGTLTPRSLHRFAAGMISTVSVGALRVAVSKAERSSRAACYGKADAN